MVRRKRRYWLMKTEPDVYGIQDLERVGQGEWEGVRSYQARNYMREMAVGDLVLFYHSSTTPSGVAGVARVAAEAYPDHHAFNPDSNYYDPKSDPEDPRWFMVDVAFVEQLPEFVSLDTLKAQASGKGPLEGMLVVRRGQRLSVQPVDKAHFARVLQLGKAKTRVR